MARDIFIVLCPIKHVLLLLIVLFSLFLPVNCAYSIKLNNEGSASSERGNDSFNLGTSNELGPKRLSTLTLSTYSFPLDYSSVRDNILDRESEVVQFEYKIGSSGFTGVIEVHGGRAERPSAEYVFYESNCLAIVNYEYYDKNIVSHWIGDMFPIIAKYGEPRLTQPGEFLLGSFDTEGTKCEFYWIEEDKRDVLSLGFNQSSGIIRWALVDTAQLAIYAKRTQEYLQQGGKASATVIGKSAN